ncbi:MAG: hypothetical protein OEM67_05365 [Thermoleophilia bacterium]|nr:hypothetical protein [Thermoleophilia bacterium]
MTLALAAPATAASPHGVTAQIETRIGKPAHQDVNCDLVRLDPTEAILLDGMATDDGRVALAGTLISGLRGEVFRRAALHTLAHECWHQLEFLAGVEQPSNPSQVARLEGVADGAAEIITRWWCRTRPCIGEIDAGYPHYEPARARAKRGARPLAWLRDYALSSNPTRGRMWVDAGPRRPRTIRSRR